MGTWLPVSLRAAISSGEERMEVGEIDKGRRTPIRRRFFRTISLVGVLTLAIWTSWEVRSARASTLYTPWVPVIIFSDSRFPTRRVLETPSTRVRMEEDWILDWRDLGTWTVMTTLSTEAAWLRTIEETGVSMWLRDCRRIAFLYSGDSRTSLFNSSVFSN